MTALTPPLRRAIISAAVLLACLLFATIMSAQVGTQSYQFETMLVKSKGKVKSEHQFTGMATAALSDSGLELRIAEDDWTQTFTFDTTWREIAPGQYTIGMTDGTGWQWIASLDTLNGHLSLTDGSRWSYHYETGAGPQLAETR